MFIQILIGALLICSTVAIHAVFLDKLIHFIQKTSPWFFRKFRLYWRIPILIITVLGIFAAHVTQIWLWACFYLFIGALTTLESALYFSTTTFTTVGYGDVFLNEDWRLTSSFQSANGFILFGWSTAFIFEVMSRLYQQDPIATTGKIRK